MSSNFLQKLDKRLFPTLLKKMLEKGGLSAESAKNGFYKTGLYPLDRSKILDKFTSVSTAFRPQLNSTVIDASLNITPILSDKNALMESLRGMLSSSSLSTPLPTVRRQVLKEPLDCCLTEERAFTQILERENAKVRQAQEKIDAAAAKVQEREKKKLQGELNKEKKKVERQIGMFTKKNATLRATLDVLIDDFIELEEKQKTAKDPAKWIQKFEKAREKMHSCADNIKSFEQLLNEKEAELKLIENKMEEIDSDKENETKENETIEFESEEEVQED
jgi:hypothetical protein